MVFSQIKLGKLIACRKFDLEHTLDNKLQAMFGHFLFVQPKAKCISKSNDYQRARYSFGHSAKYIYIMHNVKWKSRMNAWMAPIKDSQFEAYLIFGSINPLKIPHLIWTIWPLINGWTYTDRTMLVSKK